MIAYQICIKYTSVAVKSNEKNINLYRLKIKSFKLLRKTKYTGELVSSNTQMIWKTESENSK